MQVCIKSDGPSVWLDVAPDTTIAEVKLQIQRKCGHHPDDSRILLGGKSRCDTTTLAECGISDESTLQLLGGGTSRPFNFFSKLGSQWLRLRPAPNISWGQGVCLRPTDPRVWPGAPFHERSRCTATVLHPFDAPLEFELDLPSTKRLLSSSSATEFKMPTSSQICCYDLFIVCCKLSVEVHEEIGRASCRERV